MSSYSSGSCSPNRSPLRKNTELSILSNKSCYTSYQFKGPEHSIGILMLECYLSDICKSISEHKSVTHQTYTLVPPIDNILQDCMGLCNITLQFYTQVKSALSLICKIFEETCDRLIKDLVLLLAKICEMIAKGEHFSHEISVPVRKNVGNDVEACLVELKIRVNRVTPRVINVFFI